MQAHCGMACRLAPGTRNWASQRLATEQLCGCIGFQHTIEGIPAVNYDLMLQEMLTKTKGKVNEILYWSRPLDWHNQTLTPNPDAIYLMAFTNTKDIGPVVIEVPPAEGGSINGNIVNVWQMALEDAGPSGADQGKGGKYLVLPPDYTGKIPEGYIPLHSDTFGGYALMRSNLASHSDADVAKSVEYAKRLKVYPLSQAANPPETIFTDAKDVVFDSTIRYDASFFKSLDRVLQSEPWLPRDRAMIDQVKSVGIEKGKSFAPTAPMIKQLEAGVQEGREWLEERYDTGLIPFYEKSRWNYAGSPELVKSAQASYDEPNSYPVDLRGVAYSYAFVGLKRMGTGQFYLMSIKDKEGNSFDGSKTYKLTVPANVPVQQYWSLTAYDRETHALIRKYASRQPLIPGRRTEEKRRWFGRYFLGTQSSRGRGCQLDPNGRSAPFRTDVPALCTNKGSVREDMGAAGRREGRPPAVTIHDEMN
jgi:hypothetical protein